MMKKGTQYFRKIQKKSFGTPQNNTQLIFYTIFLSLFFSALGTLLGYHYFIKPKNISQVQLEHELEEMELQYAVLNKKFKKTQEVLDNLEERDEFIYRSFFELEPISKDARKAGFGGIDRYEKFSRLQNAELIKETSKSLDILSKRLIIQSKSLDEIIESAKKKDEMFRHLPAIQPIANKDLKKIASGFGMRLHPILKIGKLHAGIDFSAPTGTPVYATGDATVAQAENMGGFGNVVVLNHGYGYKTLYAHLNKIKTQRGQKVKRGDVIGYVGSSGLSTGAHLHYEVHKNGEKVNPINFFHQDVSPDEFRKLYEDSQKMTVSLD
ncbi:Stage II sporulation protein Q [Candidatus Ornithobacterium hominis]|uniref:Stage II sporulation protein Q n=1 Tax=Candidatus Ornithobacterium hominis TaxID=2497989 RepID=A0A383U072_9FLAO|nr:M23 family metallopeptidase [Candidatus Ornithobacterium hominis]MCT7904237.1 M23 family metallopeptidase [Candidatus Ornithobacterium hominis]SZD72900.1 Stage II sporulation protein Q [Candidatus Ornithobacterium hominis]